MSYGAGKRRRKGQREQETKGVNYFNLGKKKNVC